MKAVDLVEQLVKFCSSEKYQMYPDLAVKGASNYTEQKYKRNMKSVDPMFHDLK